MTAELDAVKAHLIDAIGLALSGAGHDRVRRARTALPDDRAFVLSLAVGALGLDDFDEATRAHPAAVLVPAVMDAVYSASSPVTGSALADALAFGYRLFAELGRVADAGTMHLRGQHPTALLGALSAAGALARLHGAEPETQANAIAVAASFAAGVTEFDAKEEMRAVQGAWAASSAVRAWTLADAGFTASSQAIDGGNGLLGRAGATGLPILAGLVGGAARSDAATAVEHVSFKPYPHFSDLHPVTAVLVELLGSRPIAPDEIASITVRLSEKAASRLSSVFPPDSPKGAKRSARFVFASCVLQGYRTGDPAALFDAFGADRLGDPEVLRLAERVELGPVLADGTAGTVELRLADGSILVGTADGYPGDGRDPALRWGWDQAVARFDGLTASLEPEAATVAMLLRDAVGSLEQSADVRPALNRLTALITAA